MRSATLFLPLRISLFVNAVTSVDWNRGSGASLRCSARVRRAIVQFRHGVRIVVAVEALQDRVRQVGGESRIKRTADHESKISRAGRSHQTWPCGFDELIQNL